MRWILLLCMLACGPCLLPGPLAQAANDFPDNDSALKSWIGKPFPEFAFPGRSGRSYSNQDFRGKTTVVEVWELGCQPCMYSVKYFNAIQDSLRRAGFQFLSMVKDDWPACLYFLYTTRSFMMPAYEIMSMRSAAKTAPNLAATAKLNSLGWPFFLIVDSKGIVRDAHLGFALDWNDVHEERPTSKPYANSTIQWMLKALDAARSGRK